MATAPPQLRSASSHSASSPSQPRDSYFPVRCGDEDMVHCGARLPVPSFSRWCPGLISGPGQGSPPPESQHQGVSPPPGHPFPASKACSAGDLGVHCGRAWRAVYGPFPSSIQRTPCHPLHSCAV